MNTRSSLSMPSFDDADLDDFAPRKAPARPTAEAKPKPAPAKPSRREIDAVSGFPSREASSDGQLNLKGPLHILDRFRALCKDDRRAYYDMLEILMDRYEGKSKG